MTSNKFTYITQPHSAPKLLSNSLPTRDVPLTLMSDPRVVRGNTHSIARKITKSRSENHNERLHDGGNLSPGGFKKTSTSPNDFSSSHGSSTASYYRFDPKPFAEKDIDMLSYLIEEETAVVRRSEADTQIDTLLNLPPLETFVPLKTGVDESTQVEDTNELFDFDLEVSPLLEVIVRKTLEQALLEVCAEYEIGNIQSNIQQFETQKENEQKWIQDQEHLLRNEIERKNKTKNEMLDIKRKEKDMKSKVAGVLMVRQLMPSVMEIITTSHIKSGAWIDINRTHSSLSLSDVVEKCFIFAENVATSTEVLDGIFIFFSHVIVFYCVIELIGTAETLYNTVHEIPSSAIHTKISCCFEKKLSEAGSENGEDQIPVIDSKSSESTTIVELFIISGDTVSTLAERLRVSVLPYFLLSPVTFVLASCDCQFSRTTTTGKSKSADLLSL
jgi:hypothetical protein